MNITDRMGQVFDLCRLLETATGEPPVRLTWVGHRDAYLATIGPHQPNSVTLHRPGMTVQIGNGLPVSGHPPGLYAVWRGGIGAQMERLDTSDDMTVRVRALALLAPPISLVAPSATDLAAVDIRKAWDRLSGLRRRGVFTPTPPMVSFTHARCLVCDAVFDDGNAAHIHLGVAHDGLHIVGAPLVLDGIAEYSDADGRAVLWTWGEAADG